MIVSDRKQFIFVHNPKCAGTSVRNALMQFDTTNNLFWMFENWNGLKIDKAHMPLFILKGLYPDYFRRFDDYFSFAFVRNPYHRSISAFNEQHDDLFRAAHADPDPAKTSDALEKYREQLNDWIGQLNRQTLCGWNLQFRHFVRQSDLIYLGHRRIVGLVMRLENWPNSVDALRIFRSDLADVVAGAGRENARPLAGEFTKYLNANSVKKINDVYTEDFKLFEYEMA